MITFQEIKNTAKRHLSLYKALYQDPRTPTISKIFFWLAVGYAVMPFDLIPDFIPVIGHLDDMIIVPGLIYIGLKFLPEGIYKKHKERIFKSLSN